MPVEGPGIERQLDPRRLRQRPDVQRGALRADAIEPFGHLVFGCNPHACLVEGAVAGVEDAAAHGREPHGSRAAAETDGRDLAQPPAGRVLEHRVATGGDVESVGRDDVREACDRRRTSQEPPAVRRATSGAAYPAVVEVRNLEDAESFTTKDGSTIRELLGLPTSALVRNQSLAEATLAAGQATQRHYHARSEEIYFLLEGGGVMEVDGDDAGGRAGRRGAHSARRLAHAGAPGPAGASPALHVRAAATPDADTYGVSRRRARR